MNTTIEQQIQDFLRSEGNNIALADGLLLKTRYYHGPVNIKLSLLTRCTGPENDMKYKVSEESFNQRIDGIIKRLETGWILPPILVNYCDGNVTINDGNHRYEAYKRMGYDQIPGVFWVTEKSDFDQMLTWLGKIN